MSLEAECKEKTNEVHVLIPPANKDSSRTEHEFITKEYEAKNKLDSKQWTVGGTEINTLCLCYFHSSH